MRRPIDKRSIQRGTVAVAAAQLVVILVAMATRPEQRRPADVDDGARHLYMFETGDLIDRQLAFWREDPLLWGPRNDSHAAQLLVQHIKETTTIQADLHPFGRRLVVRTYPHGHEEIAAVLDDLRRMP